MKKIILHGHYHTKNFGDLLIADVIAQHIVRKFGVRPIIPWVHPDLRQSLIAEAGQGLRSCWQADAGIFGGGGYFFTWPTRKLFTMLPHSLAARIWHMRRCPYVVLGPGVDPNIQGLQIRRTRYICKHARTVAVRNDESRELLTRIGVPAESVRVTADWVLAMSRDDIPATATEAALRLLGPKQAGQIRLGIHLPIATGSAPQLRELLRQIKRGLGHADHVQPVFIFDNLEPTLKPYRDLADELLPGTKVIPQQDHWMTVALIGQMDAVLTTKLHVGITNWTLGGMPCAYAFHGKIGRFYRQIGRSDFHITRADSPDRVADWMRMLCEDWAGFSRSDPKARLRLRNLAMENHRLLDHFLQADECGIQLHPVDQSVETAGGRKD